MEENEYVTMEEFIEGEFNKYVNNTGEACGSPSDIQEKAESLAHFSYEHSNEELMVVDLQGCGLNLFDPEIASKKLVDNEEIMFSTGNLTTEAIQVFVTNHKCNKYCAFLDLKKL